MASWPLPAPVDHGIQDDPFADVDSQGAMATVTAAVLDSVGAAPAGAEADTATMLAAKAPGTLGSPGACAEDTPGTPMAGRESPCAGVAAPLDDPSAGAGADTATIPAAEAPGILALPGACAGDTAGSPRAGRESPSAAVAAPLDGLSVSSEELLPGSPPSHEAPSIHTHATGVPPSGLDNLLSLPPHTLCPGHPRALTRLPRWRLSWTWRSWTRGRCRRPGQEAGVSVTPGTRRNRRVSATAHAGSGAPLHPASVGMPRHRAGRAWLAMHVFTHGALGACGNQIHTLFAQSPMLEIWGGLSVGPIRSRTPHLAATLLMAGIIHLIFPYSPCTSWLTRNTRGCPVESGHSTAIARTAHMDQLLVGGSVGWLAGSVAPCVLMWLATSSLQHSATWRHTTLVLSGWTWHISFLPPLHPFFIPPGCLCCSSIGSTDPLIGLNAGEVGGSDPLPL